MREAARASTAARVLCVHDASTGAPLVGVHLRPDPAVTAPVPAARARVLPDACVTLPAAVGRVVITRVGYRQVMASLADAPQADTVHVALWQLDAGDARGRPRRSPGDTTRLAAVRVVAAAPTGESAGGGAVMRVADARERGVSSTAGLLALLPFTSLRSARGETAVSLRGARREQVVVTLDGMPLNDPATGVADVADVPLAALASVRATPGADPLGAGNGASGGVVALTTARQRLLSVHQGAYGLVDVAGATTLTTQGARWHATGSYRRARNDFPFRNEVAPTPSVETRTNNDERRAAVQAGVLTARWQASLLASHGERGMVGAMNVRTYDADRASTSRIAARAQGVAGRTIVAVGARTFALRYRDPTRPALDAQARAHAADLDWRGSLPGASDGALRWRVGGGADALRSGTIAQDRRRAFAAMEWRAAPEVDDTSPRVVRGGLGVRVDVVERSGVQPTGAADLTWRVRAAPARHTLDVTARAAQAVRVPTLYDLYFSAPQRLTVKPLAPERVVADLALGLASAVSTRSGRIDAEVQLVSRDTRNAIVWFPGNFGWSPDNVGRETLRGVEARVALVRPGVMFATWATRYTSTLHTGTAINTLRIPTPYVPTVQGGAQLRLAPPRWGVVWSAAARVQGRRPYTAGPRNSAFELAAAALLDVAAARTWRARGATLLTTVAIDNATDRSWQSVRGFPMPGRTWSLGITLTPAAADTPR